MLNLTSPAHVLRAVISNAANITCHTSWVDTDGTNASIDGANIPPALTAGTFTLVAGHATLKRNIKACYLTNKSASANTRVAVELFDGTNVAELMGFNLLPGENMTFNEEGRWMHKDAQGAEYPPAGLGAYTGAPVGFMKSTTGADTVGYWYCSAKDNGFPGAWAPGTPGVNGRVTNGTLTADNGCVPVRNPSVGANFLTELQMAANVNHTHLFFDVLWVNSGLVVTTTTAQAFTVPTLPARDVNGTNSGEGCMIAMLFTTASTNAAAIANTTITYTNSAGVAGRVATLSAVAGSQIPVSPAIGTLVWFNLAAGDKGVQAGSWSITLGTSLVAGAISLLICRDVATIGTIGIGISSSKNVGTPGIRLYNDTCLLHCYLASATTATFCSGELSIMEK